MLLSLLGEQIVQRRDIEIKETKGTALEMGRLLTHPADPKRQFNFTNLRTGIVDPLAILPLEGAAHISKRRNRIYSIAFAEIAGSGLGQIIFVFCGAAMLCSHCSTVRSVTPM